MIVTPGQKTACPGSFYLGSYDVVECHRSQLLTVFLVTRSSTGIDDPSYPGLYSLVSDYFGPKDAWENLWFTSTDLTTWLLIGYGTRSDA